jgi:RNA polymerase sigma-70 factor (ECF subfamily)
VDDHLFRREAGRMVAALTRVFGVQRLALAEDVVQDAFCRALESWRVRGVPDNPAAWLMTAARHRAIDVLRRERTARVHAPELERDEAFEPETVRDDQLRMMFSCCHPQVPEEAQVALILNILCGFGAGEIASAFLTGRAAIEKRIARGKKVLAGSTHLFDLGDAERAARLSTVQRALYLLFNEGYQSPERTELCEEAIRLVGFLREHPLTAGPATDALGALMCLHAARLPARIDAAGELCGFAEQDRARWDGALVGEGLALFERSAAGEELTAYHLEAAIAATHAAAPSAATTDWAAIVGLYDRLMTVAPSPVVALSRAIAIGERDGADAGLAAMAAIVDRERLAAYPFFPAALAELELRRGARAAARAHFAAALALARNGAERRFLEKRLALACDA